MVRFSLVSFSRDSLKVWAVDGASVEEQRLVKSARAPRSAAWNHTCHVVACGLKDGMIELVAEADLRIVHKLSHGEAVTHLAFSGSSRYLCSGSESLFKLWDLKQKTGGEILRQECVAPITGVAFDVRLSRVAVADTAGLCRVLPIASDSSIKPMSITAPKAFSGIQFLPHESLATLLVGCVADGANVCVWDVASSPSSPSPVWAVPPSGLHDGGVGCLAVAYGEPTSVPDSLTAGVFGTCGRSDGKINIFSAIERRHMFQLRTQSRLTQLGFFPDGIHLIVGDEDGFVEVMNSSTAETSVRHKAHSTAVCGLALAQKPKSAASATGKSTAAAASSGKEPVPSSRPPPLPTDGSSSLPRPTSSSSTRRSVSSEPSTRAPAPSPKEPSRPSAYMPPPPSDVVPSPSSLPPVSSSAFPPTSSSSSVNTAPAVSSSALTAAADIVPRAAQPRVRPATGAVIVDRSVVKGQTATHPRFAGGGSSTATGSVAGSLADDGKQYSQGGRSVDGNSYSPGGSSVPSPARVPVFTAPPPAHSPASSAGKSPLFPGPGAGVYPHSPAVAPTLSSALRDAKRGLSPARAHTADASSSSLPNSGTPLSGVMSSSPAPMSYTVGRGGVEGGREEREGRGEGGSAVHTPGDALEAAKAAVSAVLRATPPTHSSPFVTVAGDVKEDPDGSTEKPPPLWPSSGTPYRASEYRPSDAQYRASESDDQQYRVSEHRSSEGPRVSDGQYRVNEGSYRVADLEAVLDSRLEPLGHAVKCLHLELLRQMHASRREEGERAAAFRSAMETMSAEMESLREENARLRKLWRG